MLTSAEEVTAWLKTQEELVVLMGGYLQPLRGYLDKCAAQPDYAADMNGVYQLHALVRAIEPSRVHNLLQTLGLLPYYQPLINPYHQLVINVTNQTIIRSQRPPEGFVPLVQGGVDGMSEVTIAIAKVPPPPFSITLAAGTPFDAYLLIARLVENATDFIYIVDAYCDASLFSRYLFRVKDGAQVSVRTSPSKWSKKGWKEQFEEAEALFSAQHPEYDRQDRDDLHARYLVTETGGWRIDGSIKDIAVSKDCPIHTITPEERERVIADYFTVTTP